MLDCITHLGTSFIKTGSFCNTAKPSTSPVVLICLQTSSILIMVMVEFSKKMAGSSDNGKTRSMKTVITLISNSENYNFILRVSCLLKQVCDVFGYIN